MRRMPRRLYPLFLLTLLAAPTLAAKPKPVPEEKKPVDVLTAKTFAGLKLRPLGPALTSGRIVDLAVHPQDPHTFYVAAAAGGVWKTVNHGTTWEPIFDGEGSSSIGCVVVDPHNPQVVWVGTGENNSQRSVGYGDGVYKSLDGGKSWQRMGLENSEHIGKIVLDPRNSDTVYVAAQGPLWSAGGDRGLYKSADGGKSWQQVLAISEHTGVSDLVLDPRHPDTLYAAAYQRRRHVFTLIGGGPESAIYKSTDGGKSWRKLQNGLPKVELGRIGLALSPVDPDVVFALVEAAKDAEGKSQSGFYRSRDRGENWTERSSYNSSSPQYYQELFPDPQNIDRIYSVDVWLQVSEDGGKTFRKVPETWKHVDNHVVWIDPTNSEHLLVGCDGGLYETYDRGATWHFFANLPITQFYKVAVDNALPFYHVYGGTQDNFSLGGPVRTASHHGITNADWEVTLGGDGFQARVDPQNPDIVYTQLQYGALHRYDRRSGERLEIQPQLGASGETRPSDGSVLPPLRFNWDAPLILSPHSPTRLYFAANRLFRSDDRGDTWQVISPDLTRQLDRNQLPVMGKIWSMDAVVKNRATSFYGNIVALSESPKVPGLLYVGTDDGLIQVSADSGASWRREEHFPGVPEQTYVQRLEASQHQAEVVYAAFNNHKRGDFKPYLLRSADRGQTWQSISGDLPPRGSVYALVEDSERQDLLFVGTEFGVFFTLDSGQHWIRLEGDMPTVAVRDLAIQARENDLVVATFGRGFYVLDDCTPLRQASADLLAQEATLFPVKPAWTYIESQALGLRGKSFMGDSFYAAPNPPFGAIFTYYLQSELKTRRAQRLAAEKEADQQGQPIRIPPWEELRRESREEAPTMVLTVTDENGQVVRRLSGPTKEGFHRVAWDLRFPPPNPIALQAPEEDPFENLIQGPLVVPGTYRVALTRWLEGEETALGSPQTFTVKPLGTATLPAQDRAALLAFQQKTAALQRAVLAAVEVVAEAHRRLDHIDKAIRETPAVDQALVRVARASRERLRGIETLLSGDDVVKAYNEPVAPSISERVEQIIDGHWWTTAAATTTFLRLYDLTAQDFAPVLAQLRQLIEVDLRELETQLENAQAPWTPGRLPQWQP